jgi:hypothetical protein
MGREQPDWIVLETIHEHVQGLATVEDVRAAMVLALEAPGWERLQVRRFYLAHVAGCVPCLEGLLALLRSAYLTRQDDEHDGMAADLPFVFGTAKGVH